LWIAAIWPALARIPTASARLPSERLTRLSGCPVRGVRIVTYQHPGENSQGTLSIQLCPFADPFVARRLKAYGKTPYALEQEILTERWDLPESYQDYRLHASKTHLSTVGCDLEPTETGGVARAGRMRL
jgi:hypothetical protein